MKIAKTLEAVYIVGFDKININRHRKEAMYFRRT